MISLLDFYHEYINHCNLFLKCFNVNDFKDKVKVTTDTSIDLKVVLFLNKDYLYLTEIKNNKACVLDDTNPEVISEFKNKLETTDLNFLLHSFMIGGFVYKLASYDLDGQTNHFFEMKHLNNLTFSNYGNCMGAAFDDALNRKYDLLNILGYNLEKIFSEMEKIKVSLEIVLSSIGYEIKAEEIKNKNVLFEKQSPQN